MPVRVVGRDCTGRDGIDIKYHASLTVVTVVTVIESATQLSLAESRGFRAFLWYASSLSLSFGLCEDDRSASGRRICTQYTISF